MTADKFKIPSAIISRIANNAPSYTISENYGRKLGFYSDRTEEASGYKSICIYIQNGLAEYLDLFKELSRAIFKIQVDCSRQYPLCVFGFSNTEHLQHENKYFDLGHSFDYLNHNKVAETIARISGSKHHQTSVIPELFPQVGIQSLYFGKIKIERDDLLIIIGRKNEVFFSKKINQQITARLKKHILQIEIDNENINYYTRDINIDTKPLMKLSD